MTIKGDTLKVYHNKTEVERPTHETTFGPSNWRADDDPNDAVIGSYFTDYSVYDSTIVADELAMWNRALSEEEVAQLYDATYQ